MCRSAERVADSSWLAGRRVRRSAYAFALSRDKGWRRSALASRLPTVAHVTLRGVLLWRDGHALCSRGRGRASVIVSSLQSSVRLGVLVAKSIGGALELHDGRVRDLRSLFATIEIVSRECSLADARRVRPRTANEIARDWVQPSGSRNASTFARVKGATQMSVKITPLSYRAARLRSCRIASSV